MDNTIQQQESFDFFDSNVSSEIELGIIEALDESDGYEIKITYNAVAKKFTRKRHRKGFNAAGSQEIIVAQIQPWSLLDSNLDISKDELEAMTEDEKKDMVVSCAFEWAEDYDYTIEEARKLIPGYEV